VHKEATIAGGKGTIRGTVCFVLRTEVTEEEMSLNCGTLDLLDLEDHNTALEVIRRSFELVLKLRRDLHFLLTPRDMYQPGREIPSQLVSS
jgi:hypothetical protein